MEAKDVSEKSSHNMLVQVITWVLCIACVILFVVISAFALKFHSSQISGDPAAWGQFGDFIGGVSNPALAFLSLIALCLTIVLQSRQLATSSAELELSRKELELTRDELRKSARAQEESEKSLRQQALAATESTEMASINFLLEYYQVEIAKLSHEPMTAQDPRRKRLMELRAREQFLLERLDSQFVRLKENQK